MNAYYCFSEKGEIELPTSEEINSLSNCGIEPVIFLDSCVCLHIVKVVDYGRKATNLDFTRLIKLKEYISINKVHISPLFGVLELCSRNGSFNNDKFWDFKYRIDFFEQIPLREFKKFRYNYHRDFIIFKKKNEEMPNPFIAIQPALSNTYCALLKIRLLALRGTSRKNALENIDIFTNWMMNDLDLMLGIEYKLALYIFGGRTEFRKMIGLDSEKESAKKNLLGTTWDIFHSRNTSNNFRLSKLLQDNILAIFMTSDLNLFKMFQSLSLRLVKNGDEDVNSSFLFNSDFSFPHFDENFIDQQNRKIMKIFIERHSHKYRYDHIKVCQMIETLEVENGF